MTWKQTCILKIKFMTLAISVLVTPPSFESKMNCNSLIHITMVLLENFARQNQR